MHINMDALCTLAVVECAGSHRSGTGILDLFVYEFPCLVCSTAIIGVFVMVCYRLINLSFNLEWVWYVYIVEDYHMHGQIKLTG